MFAVKGGPVSGGPYDMAVSSDCIDVSSRELRTLLGIILWHYGLTFRKVILLVYH